MKTIGNIIAAAALLGASSTAQALCVYKGEGNAKTTLQQEFSDSAWVVKARVLSAKDHWSDTEDPWTSYEIEVQRAFKGNPPKRLHFFTLRDSGGFYMDRPLPAGHDIGGEYLLFLNPIRSTAGLPAAAKGAVFVNYSCGQSRSWAEVSTLDRTTLAGLAGKP